MLTLFDLNAPAAAPILAPEPFYSGLRPLSPDMYEAVLAQAEAKNLKHVPGSPLVSAAEPCRTWICDCTRAVPHGSFL